MSAERPAVPPVQTFVRARETEVQGRSRGGTAEDALNDLAARAGLLTETIWREDVDTRRPKCIEILKQLGRRHLNQT